MSGTKKFQILLCDGPSCGLCHDSAVLKRAMLIQIEANPSLSNRVVLRDYTCFGRCSEGPNLLVREIQTLEEGELEPSANDLYGVHGFYSDLDASRCARIVSEHCEQDRPIADWVDEY